MRKKKRVMIALAVILGAGFIFLAGRPLARAYQRGQTDAGAALAGALMKTTQSDSYRYDLRASFDSGGQTRVISEIEGARAGGRAHIRGEMVRTPVDIYSIDGALYHYDTDAARWFLIEDASETTAAVLISELAPFVYLRYTSLSELGEASFADVDGCDCLILRFKPEPEDAALKEIWRDFQAVAAVDYKKGWIRGLEITATNRNRPDTVLTVKLHLKDFNRPIAIEAPELTAGAPRA